MRKKLADKFLFLFVFEAREDFFAEVPYCFRTIEWEFLVHYATIEVAWLAALLEDRLNLSWEVDFS